MTDEIEDQRHWWGRFPFDGTQTAFWRIGPLDLWAERRKHEFRVSWLTDKDPAQFQVSHERPAEQSPPESALIQRFGFSKAPDFIDLVPRLSDRPVVARPEEPFSILPDHDAVVFISTPAWVGLRADDADMLEVASYRPTNTWFGDPDSHEGELCYSIQTRARMELGGLASRVRAVTQVTLHNGGKDRLDVDRIKLPMRFLTLYVDNNENLWTQPVTFHREEDGQLVGFRLAEPEPGQTLLTEPREVPTRGGFLRAVNHLLR